MCVCVYVGMHPALSTQHSDTMNKLTMILSPILTSLGLRRNNLGKFLLGHSIPIIIEHDLSERGRPRYTTRGRERTVIVLSDLLLDAWHSQTGRPSVGQEHGHVTAWDAEFVEELETLSDGVGVGVGKVAE